MAAKTIVKYTLVFLLTIALVFSAWADDSGARLLFGEEYFNALHKAFQQAQDSICVQMYYMGAAESGLRSLSYITSLLEMQLDEEMGKTT